MVSAGLFGKEEAEGLGMASQNTQKQCLFDGDVRIHREEEGEKIECLYPELVCLLRVV